MSHNSPTFMDFLITTAILLFIVLCLSGMIFMAKVDTLDERGGNGEECYPNNTCMPEYTCYELSKNEFQCRTVINKASPPEVKK